MSRLKQLTIVIILMGVVALGFSASASASDHGLLAISSEQNIGVTVAPEATPTTVKNDKGDSEVTNGNLLLQYGPQGGIVTILIGGILMILKAYKDARTIDVEAYKKKADEAQSTADREIAKYRTQNDILEAKNSTLNTAADNLREALETRKAQFTADLMAAEARHRRQVEELHHNLMDEMTKRHHMEQLLAVNGLLTSGDVQEDEPTN